MKSGWDALKTVVFLMVLLAFLSVQATAQESPLEQKPDTYVKIRLLPEAGTVAPGQSLWIGIEQSIHPHWHTYWKNPGDSGAAPRIQWQLPEGFEIGEILWPAPQKIPFGPLLNYGYENSVILLQQLTVPNILPEGPITLTADIEILVCNIECIPEYGTYSLTLNAPGTEGEDNAAYLAAALAKVPVKADWNGTFTESAGNLDIRIAAQPEDLIYQADPQSLEFIPADWGIIKNAEPSQINAENAVIRILHARDTRPLDALEHISGLLAFDVEGARIVKEFSVSADTQALTSPGRITTQDISGIDGIAVLQALFIALIGGLILNLMPCVFPVLSIKALSLVKLSGKDRALARMHGFAYTAGVVLSFLVIAGALIALQMLGAQIGWGFQLQNPFIVTLLAYLLFVIGLNLSGFFEISGRFSNLGQSLTNGHSVSASFFTGILAALVATPCMAPFMAAAIGFALTQHPIVSLIVFAALGLGLALPYLLLCIVPGAQKILPKPGAWMDVFKEFLAFPMFASAAWLVWVVSLQSGADGVLWAAFGMVFIAFAIWLWKHAPQQNFRRTAVRVLSIALIVIALIGPPKTMPDDAASIPAQNKKGGLKFSQSGLQELLQGDAPVFVEMTAAWCITCKVNQKTSLDIDSTRRVFAENGVQYMVGDWTNQDPEITAYLKYFERSGVPIYVYYGPPNAQTGERPEPYVLPQILTPGIVADAINGGS